MKKKYIFIIWLLSILLTANFINNNPNKIENLKNFFNDE